MSIPTVSLPTAQLLKEAGFKQDTDFHWRHWSQGGTESGNEVIYMKQGLGEMDCWLCAAPSTDEILAKLPDEIKEFDLIITKSPHDFGVCYCNVMNDLLVSTPNPVLCEALAASWLWLRKEGLI